MHGCLTAPRAEPHLGRHLTFTSIEFVPFLLVVLVVHAAVAGRHDGARRAVLLVASLVFFASWTPTALPYLVATIAVVYLAARGVRRDAPTSRRRIALVLGLGWLFGSLAYYKYRLPVLTSLGLGDETARWIAVPIGISYVTFLGASHLIDVFRGAMPARRRLADVALHLSLFPYVLAGPIVRARQLMPQLEHPRRPSVADVELAIGRIVVGLVKKIVLADALAGYTDGVFLDPGVHPAGNLLLATYAYAFQLYFDFSGYCDMAIGIAALFGITLPENFRRPYLATSIRDFWQRWHITLYSWLRDYLFLSLVALGRNRREPWRIALYSIVTMGLAGLWHGPRWSFVAWGLYHGALLGWEIFRPARTGASGRALWWQRARTFHLVCIGLIIFRVERLTDLAGFAGGVLRPSFEGSGEAATAAAIVALGAALHLSLPADGAPRRLAALSPPLQGLVYAGMVVACIALSRHTSPFIYAGF